MDTTDVKNETAEPKEAEAKVELTDQELMQKERARIAQELRQANVDLSAAIDEIMEKGFQTHVYKEGGMVEIPGHLFANMINFIASTRASNMNMGDFFTAMLDRQSASALSATQLQVLASKEHIRLCESGVTMLPETPKEETPVDRYNKGKKKSTKKKATGEK